MIDLHLHLDGSLPPALLIKLAEKEGVILPGRTGVNSFFNRAQGLPELK